MEYPKITYSIKEINGEVVRFNFRWNSNGELLSLEEFNREVVPVFEDSKLKGKAVFRL